MDDMKLLLLCQFQRCLENRTGISKVAIDVVKWTTIRLRVKLFKIQRSTIHFNDPKQRCFPKIPFGICFIGAEGYGVPNLPKCLTQLNGVKTIMPFPVTGGLNI